jgi:hypothetical protein
MKRIAFLLLFLPSIVSAQLKTSGPNEASGMPGLLYSANSWSSLANDWDTNSVNANIVSNKIRLSAGANSDLTHYFSYKDSLAASHVKLTVKWKMTTAKTANDYGLALGFRSVNSTSLNHNVMIYDPSTGGTAGRFQVFFVNNGGSLTNLFTMGAGSAVSYSQNDYVLMMVEKNNNQFRCFVQNLTTNAQADTTFTMAAAGSGMCPANFYEPTIFSQGPAQTCEIDSIAIQVFEPQNADILVIGDSKVTGYEATWSNTWLSGLHKYYPSISIHAGAGNKIADALKTIPYIISLRPKNVIIAIGSNDVRQGISSGTWQANYVSMTDQLIAAGINVIHLKPMKETVLDLAAQRNWIETTYPGRFIDTWQPSTRTGFLASDAIHPSTKGHKWILDILKAELPRFLVNVKAINPNE